MKNDLPFKEEKDVVYKLIHEVIFHTEKYFDKSSKHEIAIKSFITGMKICADSMNTIAKYSGNDSNKAKKDLQDFQDQINWYFENKV